MKNSMNQQIKSERDWLESWKGLNRDQPKWNLMGYIGNGTSITAKLVQGMHLWIYMTFHKLSDIEDFYNYLVHSNLWVRRVSTNISMYESDDIKKIF